ncbi:ABC transporter substrate-binding protein [Flavimaricola marinus]|uniref:ABC transporter substrate-binding protein n=1 Tax=Flavimaricola marinus TaxID=1819565 RepID=UPI00145539EF|nr:ABC transporter substrate-binding protein [Flavimaricola marinus]
MDDPVVQWSRRSLYSFGEGDLSEFTPENDLIIYDHPFTGDIARDGLMLDLLPYLSAEDIEMLENNQVGQSYKSYFFEGGLYALPIDAAAVTAAWRPDLLAEINADVPDTLDDVVSLGIEAKAKSKWVGWAAKPTDLMCSYVTIAASLGAAPGQDDGPFLSREISLQVVELMRRLAEVAHPSSMTWNPIQLFDYMSASDDIVYTPFAFNYVNYATASERQLRFASVPRAAAGLQARGLLGGAGIAVSAQSKNPEAAVAQALRLVDPAFQAGDYVRKGGQPGMRSAWVSREADAATNGFLSGCLPAMDAAFLRPNIPGFVPFFHDATHEITKAVTGEITHEAFWSWQTTTYDALRADNAKRVTISA